MALLEADGLLRLLGREGSVIDTREADVRWTDPQDQDQDQDQDSVAPSAR
jgi:hypothetical protein